MKPKNILLVVLAMLSLVISGIACQLTSGGNSQSVSTQAAAAPTDSASKPQSSSISASEATAPPTEQPTVQKTTVSVTNPTPTIKSIQPTNTIPPTKQPTIRQWGVGATASSQYGDKDWSPSQATGEPDTPECGDNPSAWASLMGGEEEWLEVYFESAVVPSEVNIYQTYGATQITKVELLDTSHNYHEIYTGEPSETDCPFVLKIDSTDWDYEAAAVKISFDESFLYYWDEIDAVELVGLSTGKIVATPAARFPTPTSFAELSGFLWRVGGESGPIEPFSVPAGIDVVADGTVYVADLMKGVLVYDQEGHQKNIINSSEMDSLDDVAVAPNGNIYVASWGNHSVLAYDANGKFLWSAGGSEGNGPGQFAKFSPSSVTVGPDGNIFALDKNETNDDQELLRLQVFSPKGKYLRDINITEEWFTADDIDFGPDGNLYILSGNAQYILILDPQGSVVGRIGNDPLSDSYIYNGLDIDQAGNIYVASGYQEQGILKLNKYGELVAQFGVNIEDGERPWPEGGFYAPNGIGVTSDGTAVFVSDWSGPYAYLTAFSFK